MNFDRQTTHRRGGMPMDNPMPPPLSDDLTPPNYVQEWHQYPQHPQFPHHPQHPQNHGDLIQSSAYQDIQPLVQNHSVRASGSYQNNYSRAPTQGAHDSVHYQQNYHEATTQYFQESPQCQQHYSKAPNHGAQTPYPQTMSRAPNQGSQTPYQQAMSRTPNQGDQIPNPQTMFRVFNQNVQEYSNSPHNYSHAPSQGPQTPFHFNIPSHLPCPPNLPETHQRTKCITSTTSISKLSDDVFYTKSSSSCPVSSSVPDSHMEMSTNHHQFMATLPPGNFGNQEYLPHPPYQLPPLLHCPIMMLRTDYNHSDEDQPGTVGQRQNDMTQCKYGSSNQRIPSNERHRHPEANIRRKEKDLIKNLMQNRSILQVCGPPMVGKSTLVRQALTELTESSLSTNTASSEGGIIQHHFDCKQLHTFTDLVTIVINKLRPGDVCTDIIDSNYLVSIFQAVLSGFSQCHHIIVFHKCEGFRISDGGHFFSDFLAHLLLNLSLFIKLTVIFTSYKTYPSVRSVMSTVEIGVLSDIWDVVSILQYYAPGVEVLSYAHVCIKTLCLPEAVRFLAEKFIANEEYRIPADILEKKINRDVKFLSEVFGNRVMEVTEWIPQSILLSIVHFCHSVDSSFEKAHLEYVSSEHDFLEWTRIIQYLKENFVVREVSVTGRLVIHPLVIYYCVTSVNEGSLVLRGQWYDQSCNKYTNFLCRLLMNTEASMRQQGRKGLVYSGLILEWPNVKYLIERALYCNRNTFGAFLQVAVSANGLIMKCFMKEAKDFYQKLYDSAKVYGTSREVAVLQAFLGNAIGASSALTAETEVLDSCLEWNQANQLLNGAIEMLSKEAPSYHLMWALDRKATILHRQGKYRESMQCFKQAKQVFSQVNSQALGEQFFVSDLQVWEERITQEIQETIPIIFTGNNLLARKRLNKLLEVINNKCENHPELSTLLNLIGLTEERGNNNLLDAFNWYKLSYNERMYLAKMCPENLLVSLNNMAMILLRQGKLDECLKYLYQALDIRRECGWRHYSTALTLTHLSEVNIKCNNFPEAFKNALEAEKILKLTVKDHDMRLRLNFTLAHIRVVLRQQMEPESSRVHQPCLFRNDSEIIYHEQTYTGQFAANKRPNNGEKPKNVPNLHELLDDIPCNSYEGRQPSADSSPWTATPELALRDKDTTVKICPEYPCPSGHPVVTTIPVDPIDLSMSADNYLDRVIQIAHEMTGTLSDDGHSNYLATHMHAMVLNWKDQQKFLYHINAIKDYTKQNPWIEETVFVDESVPLHSRFNRLRKQKTLFFYIVNTHVEHLDLNRFTELLIQSCQICAVAERIYTCEMWRREAHHLMWIRQEKDSFSRVFDEMGLDDLTSLDFAPDVGPQENCLTHCSHGTAASCDGGGTGPPYGTAAALDSDIPSSFHPLFPPCDHMLSSNIFPQSSLMDNNNLSQTVESPKILQDQQDIMNKIKYEHQPPFALDMNITSPEGYNFTHRENQKRGSGGSKVILEVRSRVPVEQSETSLSALTNDDNSESQMYVKVRMDHRLKQETCGADVGGSADKWRLYLQSDPNTNTTPLTNKQVLNAIKLPESVHSSGDSCSQKFSVRQYLHQAWGGQPQASTDQKQCTQTKIAPSLCDQSKNNYLNDLQGSPDPGSKISCLERQLHQSQIKNGLPYSGSCIPNSSVQKDTSKKSEKTNSCGSNGQLSIAESGFAGSSLSSDGDPTNHELSQSGQSAHNISGTSNLNSGHSNVNPESGFLSQGAKPKKTTTEILANSNKENFLDSPSTSRHTAFRLLVEGREPTENCESFFSFSNSRKPEEGLRCDYSGQNSYNSEDSLQTVVSPEYKNVKKL